MFIVAVLSQSKKNSQRAQTFAKNGAATWQIQKNLIQHFFIFARCLLCYVYRYQTPQSARKKAVLWELYFALYRSTCKWRHLV